MNKYWIISIAAAVITVGVIIGILTHYLVRHDFVLPDDIGNLRSAEVKSGNSMIPPAGPLKDASSTAGVPVQLPVPKTEEVPVPDDVLPTYKPEDQPVHETEEPVSMEGEKIQQIVTSMPPSSENQAVSIATPAQIESKSLPAFTPVVSKAGPGSQQPIQTQTTVSSMPGQNTVSSSQDAQSQVFPGSNRAGADIQQSSYEGPPSSNQSSREFPQFTPVTSKVGPGKSE